MVHLWGRIMTKHALLAAVAALSAAASMTPAGAADPAAIARGKYLVTIASCHDCHTPGYFLGKPDMARFLGGSEVGLEMPGLGTWTDAQIVAAIQEGKRPDGRMLAPIMPWHAFANLTKQDVDAIVAYLRSLPPVANKVPGPFGPTEVPTSFVMKIVPPGAK